MDAQIAKESKKILTAQGIEFVCGAAVRSAIVKGERVTVNWEGARDGDEGGELICDRVLVSIGRRAFTFGLGCDAVGLARDERGRIVVNDDWETNVPGVFAIGDVIAGPMLAHKASDEGVALAELLAGQEGHLNYDAIPSVVYTHPEIAGVGKTEEQLKAEGVPFNRGTFRYAANGRALGIGETQGIVKMLAHKETDRLLGCHIVGAHAGDLIAEIALAIEFGASSEDVARTVHAHPTLAEIVKEAALDVDKRALHR
jgi:dihydrolipoamide dehydrogenase